MVDELFSQNYTSGADITTVAICIVIIIFIHSTFMAKRIEMSILKVANGCVMASALASLAFHHLLLMWDRINYPPVILYITRGLSFVPLIVTFSLFVVYLQLLLKVKLPVIKISSLILSVIELTVLVLETIGPVTHTGIYMSEDGVLHENYLHDPFRYAYVILMIWCIYLLISRRRKLITRNFYCLLSVTALMFILVAIEDHFVTTSFLSFSFSMPIVAVLFMYHHNSYDLSTGMLDYVALKGYIDELNGKSFSVLCLELPTVDEQKLPLLSEDFFHFNEQFFSKPMVFHVSQKFLLVAQNNSSQSILPKLPDVLKAFDVLHEKYMLEYRIAYTDSTEAWTTADEYLNFIDDVFDSMPPDTIHISTLEEINKYMFKQRVLSELKDISEKRNLDDERILVYAQPVLNLSTGRYSSAEALMRMKLKDIGMVFPDQFIELAEEHRYIHTLSEIILNKTCKEIKRLMEEGYNFSRISVNFAMEELRTKTFCRDVKEIIAANSIPYDKIAIELTESMDESEFERVKVVMKELGDVGIKFYLDDFGTGYSNFERIMSLPIDIIKFDRSLTISSGKDEKNHLMVKSFSDIFKHSDYQILFEGIEDDNDEARCKDMNAKYLQGYKYSKPIPIEALRNFLPQTNK